MQFNAEEIVEGIHEAILILDEKMVVVSANRSFYHLFRLTKDQTIGNIISELENGEFKIPELNDLLEEVIPIKSDFNNFEIKHCFRTIGEKVLLINGHFLHEQNGNAVQVLLSIDDITGKYIAQKNAADSEEKYKKFVEGLNSIIISLNGNGDITFFNRFSEKLFGYTRKEVIGKPFVGTLIPCIESSGKSNVSICRDMFHNPEKYYLNESEGICKDGSHIWFSWSAKPVYKESGKMSEILIDGNDITEIILSRHKLQAESTLLKSILDFLPVGLIITDKDQVIQNASRSIETILDVPIEKLLKSNKKVYLETLNLKVPGGNSINTDELPLSKSITTGKSFFNCEIDLKTDGKIKHVISNSSPIRDKQGNILGAIGVWQDLTDQIKQEKEHDRQRELLNQIINEIPIGIALYEGPDFIITIANNEYMKFTGRSKEVLGKRVTDIFPEIADRIIPELKRAYKAGIPFTGTDMEYTLIRNNKPVNVWFTFSCMPFYGEKSTITGLLLWAIETTEHVLARNALEQSRDQIQKQQTFYEQILNNTNVGIAVLQGRQLRYTYVNPTYQNIRPGISMIGSTFREIFPDAVYNGSEENFIKVYDSGNPWIIQRYKAPTPGKPEAVWEGQVVRIEPKSEKEDAFILSVAWEVTEEAKAEEQLKKTNSRFALLAHTAGEFLQAPDPFKIFGTLCEKVMRQLDCQVFFNYLEDTDSGKLHLNAYGGITKEQAKKIEWIDYNKTVCGFVARSGLYNVIENIPGSHDVRVEIVKSLGITAYACHPIRLKGGEIYGTLSFGANNRLKFSSDDLSMMRAITDQIATAMNRVRNESTIRQSERKYRWLFENTLEAISFHKLIFDKNGKIIDYTLEDANNVVLKALGDRPLSELRGKLDSEIVGQDNTLHNIPRFQYAIDSGEPFTFEQYFARNDQYFITTIIPYDSGYVFEVSMDVTDVRRSQEKVRISEARFRTIFESGILGIFSWRIDGPITDANSSFLQMLGYSHDDLLSGQLHLNNLTPAEFKEADTFAMQELKTRGVDTPYEKEFFRKDKTRVPVFLGAATYDESHHEVISFVIDITERKKLEKEITKSRNEAQERRAEMEAIFQSAPVALAVYNKDGTVREANEFYTNIFSYSEKDYKLTIIDRQKVKQFTNENGELLKVEDFPVSRALRGENVQNQIMRYKVNEYNERWLNVNVTPVFLSGNLIGAVTGAIDITEIKITERALRESETRFRLVADRLPYSFIIFDNSLKAQFVNDNFLLQTGLLPEQVIGKTIDKLFPKQVADIYLSLLYKVQNTKFSLSTEVTYMLEGKKITSIPHFIPVVNDNGEIDYIFNLNIDISERKQMEDELRKQRQLLEAIIESIPVMITLYDPQIKRIDVNKAFEEITGWTKSDVQQRDPMEFSFPDPEYRKLVAEYMRSLTPGFKDQIVTTKNGTQIETSWANVQLPDGRQVGIGIDISDRKKYEENLRRRTEELTNLNSELETFSYSVAHDLRNPLNVIKGYSEFLIEDCAEALDEDCKEYISQIKNSIIRMNSIIDDMLALSKISRQEMDIVTVDLSELAIKAIEELRDSQPDRPVNVDIKNGLIIKADKRLISVALGNLLGNAWKYTGKVSDPKIEFGSFTKDGQIIYYVRDNGAGFDMSKAKDLFVPFKRLHTDKEFKGTGIGLAIVERAISRHGGKIWAEGEPGKGAIFYFTLQNIKSESTCNI